MYAYGGCFDDDDNAKLNFILVLLLLLRHILLNMKIYNLFLEYNIIVFLFIYMNVLYKQSNVYYAHLAIYMSD